jgi:predicted XRE-type DNA-binding protein
LYRSSFEFPPFRNHSALARLGDLDVVSRSLARLLLKAVKNIDHFFKLGHVQRPRTKASGNVFLDLGFAPKEVKRLLAHADAQIDESVRLKQQLMDEIAEWMKEASVTQAAAAEVLHVTRPRVSDLVNHNVEKFTIDALVSMLTRIGKRVQLAVL